MPHLHPSPHKQGEQVHSGLLHVVFERFTALQNSGNAAGVWMSRIEPLAM